MARDGDCHGGRALPVGADEVFAALSDRSRRIALYYLRWRRRVDLEELADVVTGWRHADRPGMATKADRDRVRDGLHGRHLPVLDDVGLADYDEVTGTVAVEPLPERVQTLIDFANESEGSTNPT